MNAATNLFVNVRAWSMTAIPPLGPDDFQLAPLDRSDSAQRERGSIQHPAPGLGAGLLRAIGGSSPVDVEGGSGATLHRPMCVEVVWLVGHQSSSRPIGR